MSNDEQIKICNHIDFRFNDINIDKCENRDDVLLKLREILMISNLDIKIDSESKRAYLIVDGNYYLMRNISGNKYVVRCMGKIIGIELNEFYAMFGLQAEMSVIVIDGKNFQHYAYRQKYFDEVEPWFFYNEYIDGVSREFAAKTNIAYFRTSNVPMRSTYEIAKSWQHNLKGNHRRKINYTEIGFGATKEQLSEEKSSYIPIIVSTIIRDNKGLKRKVTTEYDKAYIGEYRQEYIKKPKTENDDFLGFIETTDFLSNIENYAVFRLDDPKIMEYCLEVLQMKESKEEYRKTKDRLQSLPVSLYIDKYYRKVLDGIEFFQNLGVKDQTETDEEKPLMLRK